MSLDGELGLFKQVETVDLPADIPCVDMSPTAGLCKDINPLFNISLHNWYMYLLFNYLSFFLINYQIYHIILHCALQIVRHLWIPFHYISPYSRIFIMLSRIQIQKNLHITGLKLSPDSETCLLGVYFTDFNLHIFNTRLRSMQWFSSLEWNQLSNTRVSSLPPSGLYTLLLVLDTPWLTRVWWPQYLYRVIELPDSL